MKAAGLMLGAPITSKLNAADTRVIRQLAEKCYGDLAAALATTFGISNVERLPKGQHQNAGAAKYTVAFAAGGPVLDLFLDNVLVVAARRNAARGARAGTPFGARATAIGRQPIRVGASLGEASIGLAALSTLSCGDVLVLDSTCTDEVPLTFNGEIWPEVSCRPQQTAAALQLTLTRVE